MAPRQSPTWFATRLQLDWSADLQAKAELAGIQLFRAWPPAWAHWRPEWGKGNVFFGSPNDPAGVVLELGAGSEHEATAIVMRALGVGLDRFVVRPTACAAPDPGPATRPLAVDPASGTLTR